MIFIVEIIAFRWGTAKLASIGISHDAHGHGMGGGHAAHGPEGAQDREVLTNKTDVDVDSEKSARRDAEMAVLDNTPSSVVDSVATQIIGVGILEFGVLLHRWAASCAGRSALC